MFRNGILSLANWIIPSILILIPIYGLIKGVRVYEVFVDGAKEGFTTAVRIIPSLVAMLIAVGVFRASGAMELVIKILRPITELLGIPAELLPMGIMRSLSGSGAEGLLTEILTTYGPDSLLGRMASVAMGSTETTMYCIAVYYGSIGIRQTRHTVPVGLLADGISLLTAVTITNLVFLK